MTLRKVFFWGHLSAGLTMGLVILSMCASGMLLAFQPQIINWAERDFLNVTMPSPEAKLLDPDTILAAVRKANPEVKPTFLMFKAEPNASAMMGLGSKGVLFINPYTGEILGKGSKARESLHKVEEWHRWLGNKKIGKPITGAAAIVFFLLSLSGIYLWWPRKVFSMRGKDHVRHWNWHNTLGLGAAPFILLITVTGIIMSYGLLKKNVPPKPKSEQAVRIIKPALPQKDASWPSPKQLHTGRTWGLPGQTINFLVAMSGILQIWTGLALAFRRFRNRRRSS